MIAAMRQIGNYREFCVQNSTDKTQLKNSSTKDNAAFTKSNQGKTL